MLPVWYIPVIQTKKPCIWHYCYLYSTNLVPRPTIQNILPVRYLVYRPRSHICLKLYSTWPGLQTKEPCKKLSVWYFTWYITETWKYYLYNNLPCIQSNKPYNCCFVVLVSKPTCHVQILLAVSSLTLEYRSPTICYGTFITTKVKPVYSGQSRDWRNTATVDRWPLKRKCWPRASYTWFQFPLIFLTK